MSVVGSIVNALVSYITSIWSTLRIAFGVFNTDTMVACAQLLTVIFIIGVADNLPKLFGRTKERIIKSKPDDDDEDEYEYIRVRRK